MTEAATDLLREEELLRCPRGDSVVISIRLSRRLLELLDERLEELRARGIRASRAEIIRRLILAFLKADLQLIESNRYSITIERIEITPRRNIIERAGVNTTPHHNYTTPAKPAQPPSPPQELIRRVARALKAVRYLSRTEKEEVLEPLLEELQKYIQSGVARYWISQIEATLAK